MYQGGIIVPEHIRQDSLVDDVQSNCNVDVRRLHFREFLCWVLMIVYNYCTRMYTCTDRVDVNSSYTSVTNDCKRVQLPSHAWLQNCVDKVNYTRCTILSSILNASQKISDTCYQLMIKASNSSDMRIDYTINGYRSCVKCDKNTTNLLRKRKYDDAKCIVLDIEPDKRICFPSITPFKYGSMFATASLQTW